jgi:hypothetical protein
MGVAGGMFVFSLESIFLRYPSRTYDVDVVMNGAVFRL